MKNSAALYILLICVFILCSSISVLSLTAMDEGGKAEALELVESIPADGSKAVEQVSHIRLVFNKNVVNMTVKDNNSKCFRLLDESNLLIPIDIDFADDQIEPDKKREILLMPKEPLKENMTYKVEIMPELQAKNGTILGKTVHITFTTRMQEAGSTVVEGTKAKEEKKDQVAVSPTPEQKNDQTAPAETEKTAAETQPVTTAEETVSDSAPEASTSVIEAEKTQVQQSGMPMGSMVLLIIVSGITVVIGVTVIMVKTRKP